MVSDLDKIIESINNKDLDKALELCKLYENNSNAHFINNLKGVIYHLQNNLEMAEICFLKSFRLNENFLDPLKNLYKIYNKIKKTEEMINIGKKLVEKNQLDPSFNYKLAFGYDLKRNFSEALKFYKKCIEIKGKERNFALNNVGSIYLKLNKPKISLNYFLEALKLGQNDKIIINNILYNYLKLKDKKNSDLFYLRAEKIDKDYIEFQYNKAEYLLSNNQINEAIKILEKNTHNLKFLIKLIKLNFIIGNNKEAKTLLENHKEKIEKNTESFAFLGMRKLFEGDFENGWKYYEYRSSNNLKILENIKEWKGEDLKTKHILVYYEQGLGDTIQFSRYIFPLLKISRKVTLVVQKKIQNIFRNNFSNLEIQDKDSIQDKIFDYKIALGSILKFFYREKLNINDTLINLSKETTNKWDKKFDTNKLNVGIAWSGSNIGSNVSYRSIPLESFAKLFTLDINFFCLQSEIWERDVNYFKSLQIEDFGKYNFKELLSIIPKLDLVISCDTSLLHLSASLNKETWGIISTNPDWRWGEFNKINPYTSLKLFQQKNFNNWNEVTNEIFENLKNKLKI